MNTQLNHDFPDVAKNITPLQFPLDEVGMNEVFIPITVDVSSEKWKIGAHTRISIDLVQTRSSRYPHVEALPSRS